MSVNAGDRKESKIEFDNTYFRVHDDAVLLIYNCYKSWRNGIIKDCNRCYKTINTMDKLYEDLFPKHQQKKKLGRNELIMETYRDYKEEYGRCLKNGNHRVIGIIDTIVN